MDRRTDEIGPEFVSYLLTDPYLEMKGRIVSCHTAEAFDALLPAIDLFPPQDRGDLLRTWSRVRTYRLPPAARRGPA